VDIELREDVGCIVGYAPGIPGSEVRVSLLKVADRLAERGKIPPLTQSERVALANIGRTDVSGKVGKKLLKVVKKVHAPVIKAAKAVAKSKVVKAVVKTAAKVVPAPFNLAVTGAQAAAKLGKAIAKGNPKAKKIAPVIKAAAKGKVSLPKLQAAAKKAGVSPVLAAQAAAVAKVADMAQQGDPDAKAAMNVASQVTDTNVRNVEKAADTIGKLAVVKALDSGAGRAFIVRTPEGQEYRTLVVPNDGGGAAAAPAAVDTAEATESSAEG